MQSARFFRNRIGAPLAGALLLGGCVSTSDIDRLHQHIADVEKKVDAISKQSSSKEEVAKLSDTIGKQATTLLRSNADLGTRFDDLIREMQTLAGKLEDANRRLGQLSQQIAESQSRLAATGAPIPPDTMNVSPGPGGASAAVTPVPAGAASGLVKPGPHSPTPSDLFAQATADYQRGQYDLARQGFLEYLETYPKTDLSDDAAYWIGECYAAQKKPREAIGAFDRLFRLYPQSDKSAAAHMKKGLAHLELAEKAQAIVELQFVVHEYPTSDEAKSARQRLKALGSDVR